MHSASRILSATCFVAGFALSVAQSAAQPSPAPGDPHKTIPEKIEPAPDARGSSGAAPGTSGETLSDRLNRHDGVLHPPETNAPDMRVPAPNPNPNTTPVIPPPGSPGNPSPVEPK